MAYKTDFHSFVHTPIEVALIGLQTTLLMREEFEEQMQELQELSKTRGLSVMHTFTQKLVKPVSKTWIGKGKLEEIKTYVEATGLAGVIFDGELSPSQLKNLSKVLNCKIWDRSLLILEIFAQTARTQQAKTQVALAHAQYLLPRLTHMWTHLSRQKGGSVMMRGVGEKELETDKRIVQKQIHLLKEKLEKIKKQGETQRLQRDKKVNVSLVGYTNAGKSTLMQALTKDEIVGIADKLFATLETTVRNVIWEEIPFLLSDTVGFIRKLPPSLLQAFQSTLAEVAHASILIHVVDIAHISYIKHIEVVLDTLKKVGVQKEMKMLLVCNKYDLLEAHIGKKGAKERVKELERKYDFPVVPAVALDGKLILPLQKKLLQMVKKVHLTIYPHNKKNKTQIV